jgi:hypothetical protein
MARNYLQLRENKVSGPVKAAGEFRNRLSWDIGATDFVPRFPVESLGPFMLT